MIKIIFFSKKMFYENFTLQPLFHYAHFYEKGVGSGSGSIIVLTEPDADPGGPKHTDPTDPNPEHCLLKKTQGSGYIFEYTWYAVHGIASSLKRS